jgi:general secretion pathway protein D
MSISGIAQAKSEQIQQSKGSVQAVVKDGRFLMAQRPQVRSPRQRNDGQSRPVDPNRSPDELGNPDRPQNLGSATGTISIDYEAAPLVEVIKGIGLQLGEVFIFGQGANVNTPITILSHKDLDAEHAMELLITILDGYNLELVKKLDGNVLVVQTKQPQKNNANLELEIGPPTPHEGFDAKAIHVIQIQYANAQEISEIIRSVASGSEEINVFAPTNTLIIKDTADGIRNMFKLIEAIDLPGYDIAVEFFTLNYTRAEAVATQIEDVLMGGTAGGQQQTRPNVARPSQVASARRTQNTPGQVQNRIVGSTEDTLRMVPDERLNALVVVATESLMAQVKFLIEKLDQKAPFETNNIRYVTLKNAKAEDVSAALEPIINTAPRQSNQQGGAPQGEVQPFEKEVSIQPYVPDNSLIVLASPQDFESLISIIDQIDVPPRQVSIEAIIMAVTISDAFELAIELAGTSSDDYFGFSNAVNLANAVVNGPFSLGGGPGGSFGWLDGTSTVTIGGVETTINNVPFFMKALETLSDVEILFKPNLMTVNNEESHLFSGQNIPLITGQSDVNPQSGFQSRNNIQREDVGITLDVTPQINDGDKVSLVLEISSDEVIESTVGIDVNQTGATTSKSEISTVVVVDNDDTAVIGGLIRDQRSKGFAQVPWLGDLPLIGNLFKSRRNGFTKQNLIVMVTPHIIRDQGDTEFVKEQRLNDFYLNNLDDVFGENGYIKKERIKSKRRKNYGPLRNKDLLNEDISQHIPPDEE